MPRKVLSLLVFFFCLIGAQAQSLPGMTSWVSVSQNETDVSFRIQERSINDGYALIEVNVEMSISRILRSNMITVVVYENDGSGPYGTERFRFYFEPGDGSVALAESAKTRILINSAGASEDIYVLTMVSGIIAADDFSFSSLNCTTIIETQDPFDPSGSFASAVDCGVVPPLPNRFVTSGLINNDSDYKRFQITEDSRQFHAELHYWNDYLTDIAKLDLEFTIVDDSYHIYAANTSTATSTTSTIIESVDVVLPAGTYYFIVTPQPASNDHKNYYDLYYYADATPEFSISGRVMQNGGEPMEGVSLSGFPNPVTTAADGSFSAMVPHGWPLIITPSYPGFTFDPSNITIGNVYANYSDRYFFGYQIYQNISGQVLDEHDQGIAGVVLNGFPNQIITDQNGDYEANVPYNWSGTVSPFSEAFTFLPESRSYTNITSDQTDEDYLVTAIEYTVEGTITLSGSGTGLAGVSISGSPGPVITDSQGDYSFSLAHGTDLTITPILDAYTFDPEEYVISNISGSHTADFEASPIKYYIYGHVWDPSDDGLPGVQLTGLPGDPLTNDDGFYWVEVNPGWSGTATPELTGYSFSPESTVYTAISSDQQTEYQASEALYLILSTTSENLGAAKGSTRGVTLTSNVDWTVSESADWMSVSPSSGTGDATLTLTADSTNISFTTRTTSVTVSGEGITRNLEVTQLQIDPTLEITEPEDSLDAAAGSTITLIVRSNTSWTLSTGANWLSVWPDTARSDVYVFPTADSANTGSSARSTTLTAHGGGLTRSVTIVQLGAIETGIQDTYGGSILKLYPNPAGDRVFISGNSELLTECSIELHSITGQLLLIKEIGQLMPSDAHEVDLSAFPQGQYFVKIRSKQINQVLKLVKYK